MTDLNGPMALLNRPMVFVNGLGQVLEVIGPKSQN
jgi:hypothetical protein